MYQPDPRHQRLGPTFYDVVEPAAFPRAELRYRNQRWAGRIGLGELDEDRWIRHFARFEPLPDNLEQPLALAYHGHQFRAYNPNIGDGRGFLFAQLRDPQDDRLLDLGTKGSGRTPWSRGADGRLTLKGGVREVLATEMLEAHGVYTSKTFSVIETGEQLLRQDEPSPTRSCVLVRLGHSHVRIGTFQRLRTMRDWEAMERLLDYCVDTYWPSAAADDTGTRAANFLTRVTGAVAAMGAEWMAAGFVHGVINSDNVVITGESFDYGPWRFLPTLDPGFTAAYFDHAGLYAFGRQPEALYWNLTRLAECLLPLSSHEALEQALLGFYPALEQAITLRTLDRLGLGACGDDHIDQPRVSAFYEALQESQLPFERVFYDLVGGAREERLAASPHADQYRERPWTGVITSLREAPPHPRIDEALARPYFHRKTPVTMLIQEVEAIWEAIAHRDDWGALERALAGVDELRDGYAPLLGEPGRAPLREGTAP